MEGKLPKQVNTFLIRRMATMRLWPIVVNNAQGTAKSITFLTS